MLRHDALLAGVYAAIEGDHSRPAEAIRAVLLAHVSHPAPENGDLPCAVCVGTGQGLVDGCWVHCCCACPVCSCGQPVCDEHARRWRHSRTRWASPFLLDYLRRAPTGDGSGALTVGTVEPPSEPARPAR